MIHKITLYAATAMLDAKMYNFAEWTKFQIEENIAANFEVDRLIFSKLWQYRLKIGKTYLSQRQMLNIWAVENDIYIRLLKE